MFVSPGFVNVVFLTDVHVLKWDRIPLLYLYSLFVAKKRYVQPIAETPPVSEAMFQSFGNREA